MGGKPVHKLCSSIPIARRWWAPGSPAQPRHRLCGARGIGRNDPRPAASSRRADTAASFTTSANGVSSSCEARLRGTGGGRAAELKVGGRAIKESGFKWLFLWVDGWSAVDIIALFASAALELAASCREEWPLWSSSSCSTSTFWRLRRLMGHGRWINGRFCQGCTGSISVLHVCAGCVLRIGHFRVHLSVAGDWCGLGWSCIDGSV